jgi:predicted nuclease with RNAse H fold
VNQRSIVAGIDLSETRGLDTAILNERGELIEVAWLPGLEALAHWLKTWGPELSVIAVDAPGGPAHGPGGREAEKTLRQRGVSLYLTPSGEARAAGWMQVGWRVYGLLHSQGFPEARRLEADRPCAIECFPYATYVALTGRGRPPDMEPARWARDVLRRHGYHLAGTGKDSADAVAAALTARAYATRTAAAYGDPDEGLIWVPLPLPDRLGDRPQRSAIPESVRPARINLGAARPSNQQVCRCGCGGTPASRTSRFLPGHDAKLKSLLLVRARRGDPIALASLRELGWLATDAAP